MLRSSVFVMLFPLAAGFRAPSTLPITSHAAIATQRPIFASATAASAADFQQAGDVQAVVQPAVPKLAGTAMRTGLTFSLSLLLPALALASGAAGAEHLHLGQKVALFFQKSGLPDWAVLALISMTPAIELRGGVPVGSWLGLSPAATFVICVVGNMAPIAPMLLALRSDFFKKLAKPLLSRAEKKLAGLPTGQSRTLALALFVGVPAPGTGAWTGAIIAYLLDMPFATAMGSIFAGVALAGVIMTILTVMGKAGAMVALAVLVAGGIGAIINSKN